MTKDSGGLRRLSKLDKAGAGVSLRCDLEQRYSVAREFQGDFCRDYTYFHSICTSHFPGRFLLPGMREECLDPTADSPYIAEPIWVTSVTA